MIYNDNNLPDDNTEKIRQDAEFTRKVLYHNREDVPLEELIKFLNHCIYEIKMLDQSSTENSRKIGEIICAVKENLKHGELGKWIAVNLPFSPRAGFNFMILYKVTLEHPELMALKKSVIYLIASKSFSKKIRKQLAETGAGCYDIKYKDVLILKTKLDNGEISHDSIELDKFFKKRKDINITEQLEAEDKRLITSLDKKREQYKDFITRQKELVGRGGKNEFTAHSQHIVRVFDRAITAIRTGYKKPGPARSVAQRPVTTPPASERTVFVESQIENPIAVNDNAVSLVEAISRKNAKAKINNLKSQRIANDLGLAPWDLIKGEGAVDEVVSRPLSIDLSEIKVDCWTEDTTDSVNPDVGDICAADFIPLSSGVDITQEEEIAHYESILAPDDLKAMDTTENGLVEYYKSVLCLADFEVDHSVAIAQDDLDEYWEGVLAPIDFIACSQEGYHE